MFALNLLKDPILFIGFIIALMIVVTFHEFAHAYMATRLGDDTPKRLGRVTLNPLAHLDPLGTLMLFIAGFGWGKPVLYNPSNLKSVKDEVYIAIAGPITNIILAFIFALPYRIAVYTGVDPQVINTALPYSFFNLLTELNIILAVFNFLPIPPLDGSKILYLFLPFRTRITLERIGIPLIFGLFLISYATNFDLFGKILMYPVFWLEYLVRIFPAGIHL